MTKNQIEKEFKRISYEFIVNKPDITPYPPDIVKRREYLLYAQIHLGNILDAKVKRDKWEERFETEMYEKVMGIYYSWGQGYQN